MDKPKLRPVEAIPFRSERGISVLLRDPWGISPRLVLTEPASFLASLMDGNHDLRDLQVAYMRRFGELLFEEDLKRFIEYLDEHFLLDSPNFRQRLKEVEEEWSQSSIREPAFAGEAYPEEPQRLRERLFECFEREANVKRGPLKGIIAPHIDLERGGGCYGSAYSCLKGQEPAGLVVILGTCHFPMKRPFAVTDKAFRTPLGVTETDREAVEELRASLPYDPLEESLLHRREHTIEFQLLFLQLLWQGFRILPILCRSFAPYLEGGDPEGDEEFKAFITALRRIIIKRKAMVVISADLAHVGPQFGDPMRLEQGDMIQVGSKDREMLSLVERGDAKGFFDYVRAERDSRRICGLPPIYVGLRVLEPVRGVLVDYRQWVDPQGFGAVTFASLLLYGEG